MTGKQKIADTLNKKLVDINEIEKLVVIERVRISNICCSAEEMEVHKYIDEALAHLQQARTALYVAACCLR